MNTQNQPEVIIEKTVVHNKKPAPKGSIYFVARCKHNGDLHSLWFLAKKSILFAQDEIDLRKHLTDELLDQVAKAEEKKNAKVVNREFSLIAVVDYIKRKWLRRKK